MSLLGVIGDIHGNLHLLGRVLDHLTDRRVEGLLLVGDIGASVLPCGRQPSPYDLARYEKSLEFVFEMIASTGLPYAYVPGNHDLPGLQIRGNCDGKIVDVAGVRVFGLGGSTSIFGFPYERTDDMLLRQFGHGPDEEFDILLAHDPPYGSRLGLCKVGEPAGSAYVRDLAERRAKVMVCGHIHESGGVDQIGECLALNAGGLGQPYGREQFGIVDEFEVVEWQAYNPSQQQVQTRR